MVWILWIIVGLMVAGTLGQIATIGKDRPPLTSGQVAFNTLFNGLVITAIIVIGIFN